MDWTSCLPADLLKQAYWFNGEAAWDKSAAMKVLNILRKSGRVVLGVDIWIPTADGPRIPSKFVYDLDLTASQTGNLKVKSAGEFVENFRWSEEDAENQNCEPFFVFTANKLNG